MPGIADNLFWDQLLQLIAEGHVVPIVGRDLLRVKYQDQDVLLYPLIAQKLAKYLDVPGDDLQDGDEINSIVYRYIEKGNRIEDIYSALKIVMPADNELSIPESFGKLAAIRPFKLFVTTTFDSLLERAINQERFDGQPRTRVFSYTPNAVEDLPGPPEKLGRPMVFHIFGKLSAIPAYAVTQEDTLEFVHSLQSESHQPHILFDELNRNNLLILGCSFGDWLARFFIRTAKHQRLLEARGSTNYVADSRINSDNNLVLFLRHYSSRTRIFEETGAPEFIDELYSRWMKRYPVEEQADVKDVSDSTAVSTGAVFLSYASEDIEAVINIRNSLENEGVDVFFDKDALKAGDYFEAKLKRSISECALFVPVISKNTLTGQRRFFRIEWNLAIDESRKAAETESFIVPVVIDDTSYTETAVPEPFRKLHWERLPGGQTNTDFLTTIRQLYRKYQKMGAGA